MSETRLGQRDEVRAHTLATQAVFTKGDPVIANQELQTHLILSKQNDAVRFFTSEVVNAFRS